MEQCMTSEVSVSGSRGLPGRNGTDLTTGSVVRHLVLFSLPILMGSVLQSAYSIINAAWVGNILGTGPMAAITVSLPIFFTLMAVAAGLVKDAPATEPDDDESIPF